MADERLRRLERSAGGGDLEADAWAGARLLVERLRAGKLTRSRLELAAHLGHAPAGLALEGEVAPEGATLPEDPDGLRDWVWALVAFGEDALEAAVRALAGPLVEIAEDSLLAEPGLVELPDLLRAWVAGEGDALAELDRRAVGLLPWEDAWTDAPEPDVELALSALFRAVKAAVLVRTGRGFKPRLQAVGRFLQQERPDGLSPAEQAALVRDVLLEEALG